MPHRALRPRAVTRLATIAASALVLASCTLLAEEDEPDTQPTADGSIEGTVVTLVTHESFSLPKKLVRKFRRDTGATLRIRPIGDAGKLTNTLALNTANPLGDVAFGVDNTFASRAVDEGVFAEYDAPLPASAQVLRLDGDGADRLVPVDQASVCVNVDTAWFDERGMTPPETFEDLADPAYANLFVVPGASTSSPGLAFLLATVAEYGEDGWQEYWGRLVDNGAQLTEGWSDAYYGSFTGGGEGDRPIVVSYDTSPAFTIDEESGESTTKALLGTCFRQVEYAGVLENSDNPAGAEAAIDFLLSPEVQAALPDNMYVFPVDDTVELPEDWAKFAVQPEDPLEVSADDIAAHRAEWLQEWNDIISR